MSAISDTSQGLPVGMSASYHAIMLHRDTLLAVSQIHYMTFRFEYTVNRSETHRGRNTVFSAWHTVPPCWSGSWLLQVHIRQHLFANTTSVFKLLVPEVFFLILAHLYIKCE